MKKAKRIISFILLLMMLLSVTAGIDLSAYAAIYIDEEMLTDDNCIMTIGKSITNDSVGESTGDNLGEWYYDGEILEIQNLYIFAPEYTMAFDFTTIINFDLNDGFSEYDVHYQAELGVVKLNSNGIGENILKSDVFYDGWSDSSGDNFYFSPCLNYEYEAGEKYILTVEIMLYPYTGNIADVISNQSITSRVDLNEDDLLEYFHDSYNYDYTFQSAAEAMTVYPVGDRIYGECTISNYYSDNWYNMDYYDECIFGAATTDAKKSFVFDMILPTKSKSVGYNFYVSEIGFEAFKGYTNLKSIDIFDNIKKIEQWAFEDCSNLTELKLPNSIEEIGAQAFLDCIGLTEITIPKSLKVLDFAAFEGCSNMEKIVIESRDCTIGDYEYTIPEQAVIYGYNGSTAQTYAEKYDRQFVALESDETEHTHAYVMTERVESTCSLTGYILYTCECGDSYIYYLPAQSHRRTVISGTDSTCTQTGLTDGIYCANCELILEPQEVIPLKEHTYEIEIVSPSNNSQGYTKYTCSVCGYTYNADYFDAATVYSDLNEATAGSTISIPVSIKNNTGILGWKLTFDYDTDVLTPISVDYGDVISSGIQDNIEGNMVPGSINVYWAGSGNEDYNGVMIYINFAVNQSAVGNTTIDISYSPEDTFDDDFNDVYLDCQPININITNDNYTQFAKINASADDVIAGDDVQLKLNISEINNVSNMNLTVDYNADNFEFRTVTANGVVVKDTNSNGKITLDISGISSSLDTTDFVILTFKAKDKAMSGEYDFAVSSANEGIICKSCSMNIKPSATSEIAEIYADDVTANYGDEITIPVYIENNHGIMGYRLDFKYNADLLEPISVTCPTEFSKNGQFNDSIGVTDGEFKVLWNNIDEKFNNGILLTLKFKVITDMKTDTVISMAYSQPDTFNEKYEDVVFNCSDINVSLNNHQHSYTPVVTAPTCTEQGYTAYICECGDSYKLDYTNPTGHELKYIGANDNNELEYTCEICGDCVVKSIDEVYALWDIKYVNKPPNSTAVDNSSYLDVVQDNVINAKDFAVINNLQKIKVK